MNHQGLLGKIASPGHGNRERARRKSGGWWKEGKHFFFEKKKQKTFDSAPVDPFQDFGR
jgi:hypothetical protein